MRDVPILERSREFFLQVFERDDGGSTLEYADDNLKRDRGFVLAAINNGGSLCSADAKFKADRDLVLAEISRRGCGWMIMWVDESLKRDREVALAAVTASGSAIQYVDAKLQADREIVEVAIKNGGSIQYADAKFRADRDLVLAAVALDWKAIKFADDTLKRDREFFLQVYERDGAGSAIRYADDKIKIWVEASERLGTALTYERVSKMHAPELKACLAGISYCGRSKLRRVHEMRTALYEDCGLRPAEDAACTALWSASHEKLEMTLNAPW